MTFTYAEKIDDRMIKINKATCPHNMLSGIRTSGIVQKQNQSSHTAYINNLKKKDE